MHLYSSHLRSAADDRMLGISMQKRAEHLEMRNKGLLQEQEAYLRLNK